MAGKQDTICWGCANAVPNNKGRGCEWSKYKKPVDGWVAVPTVVAGARLHDDTFQQIPSFKVEECPKYVSDVAQYAQPLNGKLKRGINPYSLKALRSKGQKVSI